MITLISFLSIMLLIILLLTITILLLSNNAVYTLNSSAPFECGFTPINQSRIPFSLRFFLLMILFIVFDVEIVLLMTLPLLLPMTAHLTTTLFIFISVLIAGMLYEWNEGSLNWLF